MASLSRLIKEKGRESGGIRTEAVRVQQIHYTKLRESGLNFYTRSEEEVAELADAMLIAGGILQPLIVRKTDMGEYEILAGHKRRRASIHNVERGYREYEFLPCIVIDMGGLMARKISEKVLSAQGDAENDKMLDMIAEYIVICTNSTTREGSNYEKMMQAVRLSKILPAMLENEELKGRALRTEIAKEMKCGDGQVGRYQSIYNNLVPEAMERFKEGRMTVSVAYEMSGLDTGSQKEALKKQVLGLADIELLKQKKNNETVSGSDTGKIYGTESLKQEKDREAVSESDTGKEPPEAAYEPMENTESSIQYALELVFDRDDSGFPQDIMQELLNAAGSTGNVSLLINTMEKALPFENKHIKFEQACGYSIYFKQDKRMMRLALWPFWNGFMERYHYNKIVKHDEQAAADKQDVINNDGGSSPKNEPAAVIGEDAGQASDSEDTQNGQAYKVGYTEEDVREIYDRQLKIIRNIEHIRKYGEPTEGDENQYRKAKIIRDGMTYILEAFGEGRIC